MNHHPASLFGILIRVWFSGQLPAMLAGMKQIDDLNGAGEMFVGNVPDPFRSIADHDLLFHAAPAAFPSLQKWCATWKPRPGGRRV
jgi:hypothetical protein